MSEEYDVIVVGGVHTWNHNGNRVVPLDFIQDLLARKRC